MWRQARVTAYDVLDTIHVSLTVDGWEGDPTGAPTEVLSLQFPVPSLGRGEHLDWLADVTKAMLEFIHHVQDIDREN